MSKIKLVKNSLTLTQLKKLDEIIENCNKETIKLFLEELKNNANKEKYQLKQKWMPFMEKKVFWCLFYNITEYNSGLYLYKSKFS